MYVQINIGTDFMCHSTLTIGRGNSRRIFLERIMATIRSTANPMAATYVTVHKAIVKQLITTS